MKILNLYSGIGGNRKLWGDDHQVTAVEYKPEIAKIYQDHFPKDTVVVGDAHQYLLDHFTEFYFIWASPPCPSHSRVRFAAMYSKDGNIRQKPIFPSMKLYEEILFLKHYFKGKWVVENVISFYEPLIPPQEIAGHYFWSNFLIRPIAADDRKHDATIEVLSERKGFNLDSYSGIDKRLALRNCVEPEVARRILECAITPIETQKSLFN